MRSCSYMADIYVLNSAEQLQSVRLSLQLLAQSFLVAHNALRNRPSKVRISTSSKVNGMPSQGPNKISWRFNNASNKTKRTVSAYFVLISWAMAASFCSNMPFPSTVSGSVHEHHVTRCRVLSYLVWVLPTWWGAFAANSPAQTSIARLATSATWNSCS